jgi:hypothetical protein
MMRSPFSIPIDGKCNFFDNIVDDCSFANFLCHLIKILSRFCVVVTSEVRINYFPNLFFLFLIREYFSEKKREFSFKCL